MPRRNTSFVLVALLLGLPAVAVAAEARSSPAASFWSEAVRELRVFLVRILPIHAQSAPTKDRLEGRPGIAIRRPRLTPQCSGTMDPNGRCT